MAASAFEDIVALMRRIASDLEFARIVREEARRTILCSADDVDRIRWHVDQSGFDDILEVLKSQFVPAGTMYVMDRQAMDASFNETTAHWRPMLY